MRYCIHCGNPLNPGASFCHTCGAALKAVVPEADETPIATPVAEEIPQAEPVEVCAEVPVAEEPVVVKEPAANEPVVLPAAYDKDILDEKKFLDETHKFLRWEKKAWSISGKVMLIMGIVFAALFLLLGIIMAAVESPEVGAVMLVYALAYGIMIIALGIVCLKAAGKIDQYTETLYKNFSLADKRCNSIGMIVFCYFFNTIALVFFVINFVRMKCNKAMRERILKRQGVQ